MAAASDRNSRVRFEDSVCEGCDARGKCFGRLPEDSYLYVRFEPAVLDVIRVNGTHEIDM